MSHLKPFHRNYRAMVERPNSGYSSWAYIVDREYSKTPHHYVRAFILIQNDLQRLFEYVEPSDTNLKTYSYRIHELFMRACIEIEANFKAILTENFFNPKDKKGNFRSEKSWTIQDYWIINKTHHLSAYKVFITTWEGESSIFNPFKNWDSQVNLFWYQAYNKSKHDRQLQFKEASFSNLLNSIAALLILLSSQFRTETFSPGSSSLELTIDNYHNTEPALGNFFHIEFPSNWKDEEKYDFDWSILKNQPQRFEKINYDQILADESSKNKELMQLSR